MKRVRVAPFRKDGITGVGVEIYRGEEKNLVLEFIGSYYFGECSRQETVQAYVREILKQLEDDEEAIIVICDDYLRYKMAWIRIYPNRLMFRFKRNRPYESCYMLAQDAWHRKSTITEEL